MIVFTILGLLWFWMFCFEIGYHITPACQLIRSGFAIWHSGREMDRFVGYMAVRFPASAGVQGTSNDQQEKPR
jgi:hypothetical protein